MPGRIQVLDLYSGLGGFTSGFDSDFCVTHVDNCSMQGVHGDNVDYKMSCNEFLRKHKYHNYDIVLGGPLCKSNTFSMAVSLALTFKIHCKAQLGLDWECLA
tara:strand:+ start:205 stop:510 length:306 start_codon:yes stop_codon:yes gene_type:complete